MAITNTYPYVTLRTYHNISDEDLARCNFRDLGILNMRVGLNTAPEATKDLDCTPFLSIEREELIDNLSYDQFEKAAMESFEDYNDIRYSLMGNFLICYFRHLHTTRKHERWIDEGRYVDKPEEKLTVDDLLEKDSKTYRSVGAIDRNNNYPNPTANDFKSFDSQKNYENHKQWRDYMVSKYPNVPHHFPAA